MSNETVTECAEGAGSEIFKRSNLRLLPLTIIMCGLIVFTICVEKGLHLLERAVRATTFSAPVDVFHS